ncbi:hypothetical protein [Flavobacterium sp. H122]|uniref:hypothetical protein n=1 Tax=Flavobacterium sp. H122 TaxID=2529860 RepID=UPI0010AA98C7|nr:hypothetical protein [Flavobacterium sp. H122]
MKLVIITAAAAYTQDIKNLLKASNIITFSFKEVTGYKDVSKENIETNWFGSETNETESVLFYAFSEDTKTDLLFSNFDAFNAKISSKSKIHIALLSVEKNNF